MRTAEKRGVQRNMNRVQAKFVRMIAPTAQKGDQAGGRLLFGETACVSLVPSRREFMQKHDLPCTCEQWPDPLSHAHTS